ncbi:MAG TPA: hypothetical protein VFH63_02365 [candidate division Zixibacteria bacterium]|nr:hypothetical protein [candidate division Zixibacteria bacterium]
MAPIRVALEIGPKRTFAVALDWPGWARSGRTEEEALANLAAYAPRYAASVREPGLAEAAGYDVVERLTGGSGTDFGVPSATATTDNEPLDPAELDRQQRLLRAAWSAFDAAARAAAGHALRTGPRGGGRGLEKMTLHVLEAEEGYLTQLGRRRPKPPAADLAGRMTQVRNAALEALAARAHGEDPPDASQVRKRWTPRYFVRRSAWHALDHAWELEDRVLP